MEFDNPAKSSVIRRLQFIFSSLFIIFSASILRDISWQDWTIRGLLNVFAAFQWRSCLN